MTETPEPPRTLADIAAEAIAHLTHQWAEGQDRLAALLTEAYPPREPDRRALHTEAQPPPEGITPAPPAEPTSTTAAKRLADALGADVSGWQLEVIQAHLANAWCTGYGRAAATGCDRGCCDEPGGCGR